MPLISSLSMTRLSLGFAVLGLLVVAPGAAQELDDFSSPSDRPQPHLSVRVGTFDHVTLTDPLGNKTTYWYVTYVLSNGTDKVSDESKQFFKGLDQTEEWGHPLDVRLSVYLIVDVPEGVNNKEQLQNMFRRCELPDNRRTPTAAREATNLETMRFDDAVRQERERSGMPTEDYRQRSSEEVHSLERRLHEENAQIWNHNHEVTRDEDKYFFSRSQWLGWFRQYREANFPSAKAKLESLYGRELTDGSQFTRRLPTPRVVRLDNGTRLEIKFEPIQLKPGESRQCVAIFPDISPEADYIGVMFEGLVEPIVRTDDWRKAEGFEERTFVERKGLLACFARLGDEFKRDQDTVEFLGQKWVIIERYPIDYGREEYLSGENDVHPPDTWSGDDGDEIPSLRKRNEKLVDD